MSELVRKLEVVNQADSQHFVAKIAFASSDRERVDQHFGSSIGFVIYGLNRDSWQLLEVIEYSSMVKGHDDNKLKSRVNLLQGCVAIYCNAIGLMAIRQLLAIGIQPVQVKAEQPITTELKKLQDELENNPKNWLNKLLAKPVHQQACSTDLPQPNSQRLTDLLNEGWDSE